jgi:hypothetical protein
MKARVQLTSHDSAKTCKITSSDMIQEVYMDVCIRQKGGNVVIVHAALDTGCNYLILPTKHCTVAVQPTSMKLFVANTKVPASGKARIHFTVNGLWLNADVLISAFIDKFWLYYYTGILSAYISMTPILRHYKENSY